MSLAMLPTNPPDPSESGEFRVMAKRPVEAIKNRQRLMRMEENPTFKGRLMKKYSRERKKKITGKTKDAYPMIKKSARERFSPATPTRFGPSPRERRLAVTSRAMARNIKPRTSCLRPLVFSFEWAILK
jgi:hypothetical protein